MNRGGLWQATDFTPPFFLSPKLSLASCDLWVHLSLSPGLSDSYTSPPPRSLLFTLSLSLSLSYSTCLLNFLSKFSCLFYSTSFYLVSPPPPSPVLFLSAHIWDKMLFIFSLSSPFLPSPFPSPPDALLSSLFLLLSFPPPFLLSFPSLPEEQ